MSARQPCRLCGGAGSLTKEDVWPNWLRDAAIGQAHRDETTVLPPRFTMRICDSCNSRLAKSIEDPAAGIIKPMVRGESVVLDGEARNTVAVWCAKMAIEVPFATSRNHDWGNRLARDSLLNLIDSRTPPPNTFVRLALRPFSIADQVQTLSGSEVLEMPRCAMFGLGVDANFVWHSIVGADPRDWTVKARESWNDPAFLEVWPARGHTATEMIVWPPAISVHSEQLQRVRDAHVVATVPQPSLRHPTRRTFRLRPRS